MAKKGGQPGNQNAASQKPWKAAIERALAKRSLASKRAAIDDLAERFLQSCDEGDIPAFKELGDRLEGRSVQAVDIGIQADNPINTLMEKITGTGLKPSAGK